MISPSIGSDLAEPVADIYRDAELRILARIAYSLQQGIDAPEWEQLQLARLQQIRAEVLAELEAVNPQAAREIRQQLAKAYAAGNASAIADIGGALDPLEATPLQQRAAVAGLAREVARGLQSAQTPLLRHVDDVYRSVVAQASLSVLAGAEGRRAATQRAINEFLGKGLTGIQTKRGRMDISTYTTMAVRTATARAALDGQLDTMASVDLDLVLIHPGPRACKICDDWARKTLSRESVTSYVQTFPSVKDGKPVKVYIDGTLEDARKAGWGHPNCRCSLGAFLPGISDPDSIERPPWDQKGYEAQQQQRAIERQIRGWKQREALAITPEAKREARMQVAQWQERMRGHLDQFPQLKRQGVREQITGTLSGNPKGATMLRPVKADTPNAVKVKTATPKLDALRRYEGADAYQEFHERANGANPFYYTRDTEFTNNCTNVVVAMEMRARNYDVMARRIPGGEGRPGITTLAGSFRNADGTPVTAAQFAEGIRDARAEVMSWPVGARGVIRFTYRSTSTGHIANVERTADGMRLVEGQTNGPPAGNYWNEGKPGSYATMRTDNLDLTDGALDFVEQMTPEELAARKATFAADNAARKVKRDKLTEELMRLLDEINETTDPAEQDRIRRRFAKVGEEIRKLDIW